MSKNILIFSDGTGQAGGIAFDEDRTNIYKLYRATRCGPDSCIDPTEQVAHYDPGLGSPADGGFMFGKWGRWVYNLASQATGLGLTANIIDCYAALIRLYREGDRIFLFGFSRGAYTVRCLAGVLANCGIPRYLPDQGSVPLDIAGSRALAEKAVKHVYQYYPSRSQSDAGPYALFQLDTRNRIAARFRQEHGSADSTDGSKANAYPYFIGVFDTVAAIARPAAVALLLMGLVVLVAVVSLFFSLLSGLQNVAYIGWFLAYLTFGHVFITVLGAILLVGLWQVLKNYVKFDFGVPRYGFWKSLITIHLAPPRQKFTDYNLNENVKYAKHAISIDENRRDFKRVRWYPSVSRQTERDELDNVYFEQVWFAGVHADVGGGYIENESRLSDVTLRWMLAAASIVPNGVKYDDRVLSLFPDPTGPQHDEHKAGRWQYELRELPKDDKTGVSSAPIHWSVYERFEAKEVVQYDDQRQYRPPNLCSHVDFANYYDDKRKAGDFPKAVADNIESRWERKRTLLIPSAAAAKKTQA